MCRRPDKLAWNEEICLCQRVLLRLEHQSAIYDFSAPIQFLHHEFVASYLCKHFDEPLVVLGNS